MAIGTTCGPSTSSKNENACIPSHIPERRKGSWDLRHTRIFWTDSFADWFLYPPYAAGGGGSVGENPTISVTEFYVTPFDRFVYNSPEESVVSDLYPGKTIGFAIEVYDFEPERKVETIHYLRAGEWGECQPPGESKWHAMTSSDCFAVGLLLGPGGELPESAVESVTWGRIKARFAP